MQNERNFERDERAVRESVAYAQMARDRFWQTRGMRARLKEIMPPPVKPEQKEPPQCDP